MWCLVSYVRHSDAGCRKAMDNLHKIAKDLKAVKERGYYFNPLILLYPITWGLEEIDHLFETGISTENTTEDIGIFEDINNPEIYGFYRDGYLTPSQKNHIRDATRIAAHFAGVGHE